MNNLSLISLITLKRTLINSLNEKKKMYELTVNPAQIQKGFFKERKCKLIYTQEKKPLSYAKK